MKACSLSASFDHLFDNFANLKILGDKIKNINNELFTLSLIKLVGIDVELLKEVLLLQLLIGKRFFVLRKNLFPLPHCNHLFCQFLGNLPAQNARISLFDDRVQLLDKITNLPIRKIVFQRQRNSIKPILPQNHRNIFQGGGRCFVSRFTKTVRFGNNFLSIIIIGLFRIILPLATISSTTFTLLYIVFQMMLVLRMEGIVGQRLHL